MRTIQNFSTTLLALRASLENLAGPRQQGDIVCDVALDDFGSTFGGTGTLTLNFGAVAQMKLIEKKTLRHFRSCQLLTILIEQQTFRFRL